MQTIITIALLVIFVATSKEENSGNRSESSLKLVFGVLRHGEKTNDFKGTYPKDPYNNETYYPYGIAQLTNKGKKTAYQLGKKLRKIYNAFLGDIYIPKNLYAASTTSPRAKTTLQLVLAGLYPPNNSILEWNTDLNWQPIAYEHLSDRTLSFMMTCKKFRMIYDKFTSSSEGQAIEQKYSEKFAFISENTGLEIKKIYDMFFLFFRLYSEAEWGLTLPSWTDGLYPEYFENLAKDFYSSSVSNAERKRLSGGFLLNKIMTQMRLKIDKKDNEPNMFLYSGHEFNVVTALNVLNVYKPHIPNFGACVLVELHQMNETNSVKVLYLASPESEPQPLVIPGCDELCEFTKFEMLLKDNIALDENECNVE